MTVRDLLQEISSALLGNKARSGLTILGIVIGIGSVIAMIAIGAGAQGTIQSNIQALGSNLIIVFPGARRGPGAQVSSGRGSAQSLTTADADAIAQTVPSVHAVAIEVSGRYQVTARGTNTNTQIIGTNDAYPSVRNVHVANGSFLTEQHIRAAAKVAVIGPTVRDDLFGPDADPVGQTIRVRRVDFTVIGLTQAKGGSGFGSSDDVVFVPFTTASRYLSGNEYLTSMSVQATETTAMRAVQDAMTALLLERHRISDPQLADFNTLNQEDIVATAASVTSTFTLLLGSVAGISLLVGGIGIMNMMLTTVTERTREIGLRKAIGARRRDITLQFLSEAVMLTLIGGVIGIGLGWLIASAVAQFGGIATSIAPSSIVLAVGVAAVIGIAFGYYPARRAARLNPIDALRYE